MTTFVVDYSYGIVYILHTHRTYSRVRPQIFRSTNSDGHGASPSPLSLCLQRMTLARLNSLYILTLLKVEVSGSCIIVFLDVIVRISPPLESGSAVEDDVL